MLQPGQKRSKKKMQIYMAHRNVEMNLEVERKLTFSIEGVKLIQHQREIFYTSIEKN